MTGYHGTNGPVTNRPVERVPMLQKFIKAGGEIGWPELEDYNGLHLEGTYYLLQARYLHSATTQHLVWPIGFYGYKLIIKTIYPFKF